MQVVRQMILSYNAAEIDGNCRNDIRYMVYQCTNILCAITCNRQAPAFALFDALRQGCKALCVAHRIYFQALVPDCFKVFHNIQHFRLLWLSNAR